MYRNFLSKWPLFRRYTWSRCTYYLRTFDHRQMCDSATSEFDPGGHGIDRFSLPEQNISENRIVGDSRFSNRLSRAPVGRVMDRNPEDLYRRYLTTPDQPDNPRLLRVAIIGAPNAGKSTLINTLMGWKVNGVSKKVHTTRQNANTVFTIDNVQIVFVDTPGVISPAERKSQQSEDDTNRQDVFFALPSQLPANSRHHCDGSIQSDPERSLHEADAVGVIVDAENKWTRFTLHKELLKVLHLHKDVASFLILNKIDALRNKSYGKQQAILLDVTRRLCDGMLGGKEFGKTAIEKKKEVKKKKKPEKMIEDLERKYGKLEVKRKTDMEEGNLDANDEIDCDTNNKTRLKKEISNILKQSDIKANEIVSSQKKEAVAIESVETESTDSLETETTDGVETETTDSVDLSDIHENVRAEGNTETELLGNNICDKNERNIFEKSYQSDFLSRILSKPPLPEFAFANDLDETKQHEVSEEVAKVKEALAAVKDKHGWTGFDDVFLVSALDGTGIDRLKDHLVKISRPANWIYHSSVITDQHPYDIAKMCVTQSLLENMDSYLPYVMEPEIIYWDVDDNNQLNISVQIKLANTYEMGLVLSKGGGSRIRAISASARQALMDAFQCEVQFKLVFVRKKKK